MPGEIVLWPTVKGEKKLRDGGSHHMEKKIIQEHLFYLGLSGCFSFKKLLISQKDVEPLKFSSPFSSSSSSKKRIIVKQESTLGWIKNSYIHIWAVHIICQPKMGGPEIGLPPHSPIGRKHSENRKTLP